MILKEQLRIIRENGRCLPEGLEADEAVKMVLPALSSPDGELRDDLGLYDPVRMDCRKKHA